MVQMFAHWMQVMNGIVWGPPMVILLIGTGLFLTIRLRFIQLRYFKHAIECISGKYDNPAEQGDVSHFQALCAALSATIGTGNIAGVATAIALGGPGAVFWMWVTALVGMTTKFTCCSLALRYRVIHADGSASGGPMYYLERGLGLKWLGVLFAIFAGVASLGIGCAVQSNSVVDGLLTLTPAGWQDALVAAGVPLFGGKPIIKLVLGIALAFLVGIVTIGGIRRIAVVAERVVPFMCVAYTLAALTILVMNVRAIPAAFAQIFHYAFTPVAVGGGLFGTVVSRTLEKGVARGIFSNEAGLGSAPIAHAAAKTQEMIREGFVAMLGPFIDTIVICTMTALVIVMSGVWQVRSSSGEVLYGPNGKGLPMTTLTDGKAVQVVGTVGVQPRPFLDEQGRPYKLPTGSPLTVAAFESHLPHAGRAVVALGLMCFAYTTMISWSYYGDRCFEYLLGSRAIAPYRYIFCFVAVVGAVGGLDLVWTIADNLNALMALPNLVALLGLHRIVVRESKDYIQRVIRTESGTIAPSKAAG
jgi:AGCS family alanine or glycine:cation symporter